MLKTLNALLFCFQQKTVENFAGKSRGGVKPGAKSAFVVKIQAPVEMVGHIKDKTESERMEYLAKLAAEAPETPSGSVMGQSDLFVYNRDKSICGSIPLQSALYAPLIFKIMDKGVAGLKGYFYAFGEEDKGGIHVNVHEIQVPETW